MRVIKLHSSEMDVLAIRNCDNGVECFLLLPGEEGRVDVNYWIGQKRRAVAYPEGG